MQIVKQYEPIVRLVDDNVVSIGLFDTKEEAIDATLRLAISDLPTETVKAYEIRKCYVNTTVWPLDKPSKGGI